MEPVLPLRLQTGAVEVDSLGVSLHLQFVQYFSIRWHSRNTNTLDDLGRSPVDPLQNVSQRVQGLGINKAFAVFKNSSE